MLFCSTTVVADETRKARENTAVSGIRARLRKKQKTLLCARVQFAIFSHFNPLVYYHHPTRISFFAFVL
jgi:hypothetical protein